MVAATLSKQNHGGAIKRVCIFVVIAGLMFYLFMYTDITRIKFSHWKQEPPPSVIPDVDGIKFHRKSVDDWYFTRASDESSTNTTLTGKARVMFVRRQRIIDTCSRLNLKADDFDTRSRFLINQPLKIAMCYVPKVGCTYWKRVFIALHRRQIMNSSIPDIFQIRRVHTSPIQTLNKLAKFDVSYDFLTKATRIVFTRDPYSRLYSGYIDKFFLGDFWSHGKAIIKRYRANASEISLRCGHDVSFEEFLRHALRISQHTNIGGFDEHWFPVAKLCKICTFTFDLIGTQETFSDDRDFIQAQLGITGTLNLTLSSEDLVQDDIKNHIYAYMKKASDASNSCISRLDMARRLWKSFQIRGYIDKTISLPEEMFSNLSNDGVFFLTMKAHRTKILSPDEEEQQRRDMLVKAYKDIHADIMELIQASYKLDFELFDYPLFPDYLYPWQSNGSVTKPT